MRALRRGRHRPALEGGVAGVRHAGDDRGGAVVPDADRLSQPDGRSPERVRIDGDADVAPVEYVADLVQPLLQPELVQPDGTGHVGLGVEEAPARHRGRAALGEAPRRQGGGVERPRARLVEHDTDLLRVGGDQDSVSQVEVALGTPHVVAWSGNRRRVHEGRPLDEGGEEVAAGDVLAAQDRHALDVVDAVVGAEIVRDVVAVVALFITFADGVAAAALARRAVTGVVAGGAAARALARDLAGCRAGAVRGAVDAVAQVALLRWRIGDPVPAATRRVGAERAVVAGITEAVAVAVRLARVRDAGTVVEPVEDAVVVGVGQEADGLDGLAVEPRAAHRIGAVEVEVDRPDRGRAEGPRVAQEIAQGIVCRQRAGRRSPEDEGSRIEE